MSFYQLKELKIEVTHACPLMCVHCSSDAKSVCAREMSWLDCARILTEAGEMGVEKLVLSGGEPLRWDNIADAVSMASQLGMDVSIYTSGYMENPRSIIEPLVAGGCKRFVFSLFGCTDAKHERITQIRGSFQRTLTAIRVVRNLNTPCEIHFVPFADTFQDLEGVVELAIELQASQVSVLRFVPQGRGQMLGQRVLSRPQYLMLKNTIERLRKLNYSVRTGSPFNVLLLNHQPKCCAGVDRLTIGPELDIYPCDAFKQIRAEQIVGNATYSKLDRSSLRDCWEKSPYLLAVRQYLATPFQEPCSSCGVLEQCRSGCLAQKIIAYGNFGKHPDPACLLGKRDKGNWLFATSCG